MVVVIYSVPQDWFSTLTNWNRFIILISALHQAVGRASAGWGGHTTALWGAGGQLYCPMPWFLAGEWGFIVLHSGGSPRSPGAHGCPESACGGVSSPACSPAASLLSTHLDLWCNCIIWEEFLYKSLYWKQKQKQKPLHDWKGSLPIVPCVALGCD